MPLRVMIVEDEPTIALQLESIVEEAGHEVVGIAPDMRAALRIATANPHLDLAVMDIDLASQPDGVVAARRLREDHDVASLFVSANIDDEVRARALAWGPVGFIGKPFREADIVTAISALASRVPPSA
ncbi:MAG: response regulator [Methylobacterium mesophilicum]|nr:response regulator [Methylobacterium mesophilicum]